MHKRNITVGTILGAGLLGSLIALGQEAPPRPRAVMPPPMGELAPVDETPAKKIEPSPQAQAPVLVPEVPPLPIFPEPKNVIQTVQYVEPKKAPVEVKETLPKAPPLPTFGDMPSVTPFEAPKPPLPPTNDILPPPLPPKIEVPKMSDPPSAAPKAWSPGDTVAPKEIVLPDAPRPPANSTIESAPPRSAPTVPVSNPSDPPSEGASRFVVPPRTSPPATAQNQSVPIPSPYVEQPSNIPAPYRFQPVRVSKTPEGAAPRVPGPLPKLTEMPRPSGPDLTAPTADSQLGTLTPQLTVEKRGPLLHKVGGPLRYQIVLKNVGTVMAQHVRIEDEVPGALLISTTPIITQQQGDRLVWILPSLRPGEERSFVEELQPARSGDVVSTTSVQVYASTSFRTKLDGDVVAPPLTPPLAPPLTSPQPPLLTQPGSGLPPSASVPTPPSTTTPFPPSLSPFAPSPSVQGTTTSQVPPSLSPLPDSPIVPQTPPAPQLSPTPTPPVPTGPIPMTVEVKALPTIGLRQSLSFEVIITNKGSTPLSGMMLYAKVPAGFRHPEGENIGANLPNMAPGETKNYKIPLSAVLPGRYTVEIRVTADPNYELVARPVVTVEASGLSIQQSGSSLLQLNKDNEIKIVVANNQPMAVKQVQIVDVLPEGLDFVGASDRGVYQANNRTITWMLDSVPAGRARTVSLRVQPKMNGSFPHEVIARAEDLPEAKSTSVYQVESFATLQVQVQGRDGPLEEGKETIYQVRITNAGSGTATNVQASLTLSAGLDPTGFAQAPTAYRISGRDVVFAPIARMQAGETKTITLGVRGVLSGQQSVRAQVVADQLRAPVTREERTQVYREK